MALLTGLVCATSVRNTGVNLCATDFGRPAGFILVPIGVSYTPTQTSTGALFFAALQASAYNVNPSLRIYPFLGCNGIALKDTAATTETSAYGDVRTLLDFKGGIDFSFWNKGPCWTTNALSFSRMQGSYTIMYVDVNGVVAGTVLPNGNMTGYSMSNLYVTPSTINDGKAGATTVINVNLLDAYNQWGINWAYVKTNNAATGLFGINDIQMIDITANVVASGVTVPTGTYYVKIVDSCGGSSVAARYSTQLGIITQGAPFSSYNALTGVSHVIPILTNTYNLTQDAMQIGFDTSDADWVTTNNVALGLGNTSVLATAGLIGFEAIQPNPLILKN